MIEIISDSESNSKTIAEIIENNIDNVTKELQSQFGKFDIQKVSDSFCKEANKELLQSQQTTLNEMNNVSTLMRNLEASLTETQQPYFSALLEDDVVELEESNTCNDTNQVNISKINYINLKYIVVGAGAGLFCLLYISCVKLFLIDI